MRLLRFIRNADFANMIKFFLDECLPPILRDQRWFYYPIIKTFNSSLDIDFKRKALYMTNEEFITYYENVASIRKTDSTQGNINFALSNVIGSTVLEIGCGQGEVSLALAERGYQVMATDICETHLQRLNNLAPSTQRIQTQFADIESLPFPDQSFDTTVCMHTLEHVRNLPAAVNELHRVTKKRLLIVVPRERYFRYTCNYHLNFFVEATQLIQTLRIPQAHCEIIDNTICCVADIK